MQNKIELFCIGNAIVDVFASVDSVLLDEFGITEPVQHIPRDTARRLLEELRGRAAADIVFSSGGAAANVAKIAAMLNTGAAFAGCTGSDDLASVFENDLRAAGVAPLLVSGEEETGLCFAFDCSGNIRIAASPGAALEFRTTDVPEDHIDGVKALVLDGYMLDRRPLVQHILQLASCRGIPIALDTASVFLVRDKTEDILHYSRSYPLIVFMNADESIVFYNTITKNAAMDNAGLESAGEREKEIFILKEICPALKCITEGGIFPVIVIKLGSRGAVVLAGGNIYHEETVAVIPLNTVGAGDAFCAAFLSAWIRGKPVQECAALGNQVARDILLVPGTKIKAEKLQSYSRLLNAP